MSYRPLSQYTQYINPLSMCVPGFKIITLTVLEKKATKIFHKWRIAKPIKGCNSKSYMPLALILVYTILQTTFMCVPSFNYIAFIVPKKSVMNFFHLRQIVKPYQGIYLQELWALAPDSSKHDISTHWVCVYQVSTLTVLEKSAKKFYLKRLDGMTNGRTKGVTEGVMEEQGKSSIAQLFQSRAIMTPELSPNAPP